MNKNYDRITEKVLELLDRGTASWVKPWKPGDRPRNISGRPYSGYNVFALSLAQVDRGFKHGVWLTFNQAKAAGGHIRQGEHGELVIFWKLLPGKDAEGEAKVFPLLRTFTVFNIEQCEGIELKPGTEPEPEFEPLERAEQIIEHMPARPTIQYGGNSAFYSSGMDKVGLPQREQFEQRERFYSVAYHELGHSTGHASRLGRFAQGHDHTFGSTDYSKEELVAEMTATFLCSEAGIENVIEQNAAYIDGWRKALSNDHGLIIAAAAQAQKAADFILGEGLATDIAAEVGAEIAALD